MPLGVHLNKENVKAQIFPTSKANFKKMGIYISHFVLKVTKYIHRDRSVVGCDLA